jgi:phosphocarrier protein HPr
MPSRTTTIASSVGLHARPAKLFAALAGQAARDGITVTVARPGGEPANAASILAVLSLGVKHGETVELTAEGEGAEAALDTLVAELAVDRDAETVG